MKTSVIKAIILSGIALLICAEPLVFSLESFGSDSEKQTPYEQPVKESEDDLDELDIELEKLRSLFCIQNCLDDDTFSFLQRKEFLFHTDSEISNPCLFSTDIPRGPPSFISLLTV